MAIRHPVVEQLLVQASRDVTGDDASPQLGTPAKRKPRRHSAVLPRRPVGLPGRGGRPRLASEEAQQWRGGAAANPTSTVGDTAVTTSTAPLHDDVGDGGDGGRLSRTTSSGGASSDGDGVYCYP